MATTEAPDGRYRIAELARLSGFSPTTLRYYENAGVLAPPARNPAGYRLYGDRDVERLRLIARAKDLGCTLEEIAGLVEPWDADECGPVKHQLRALVDAKVAEVRRHVTEQIAFAAELEATAGALASRPADGPCDEHCGCTTNRSDAAGAVATDGCGPECGCADTIAGMDSVTFVARRPEVAAPIACSLSGGDMQQRLDEWQAVLVDVARHEPIDGGVRLVFAPGVALGELARLAAAEQDCCRFFSFALTIDDRGVALEVRAPADGQGLLAEVFGASA